MKPHIVGLTFLGLVLGSSPVAAKETKEELAYRAAVAAYISHRSLPDAVAADSAVQWSKNLGVLAWSKSSTADRYLAMLSTFLMDGDFAEELSCAFGKRSNKVIGELRVRLRAFESANPCQSYQRANPIPGEELCSSRESLLNRLQAEAQDKKSKEIVVSEPCGFERYGIGVK